MVACERIYRTHRVACERIDRTHPRRFVLTACERINRTRLAVAISRYVVARYARAAALLLTCRPRRAAVKPPSLIN